MTTNMHSIIAFSLVGLLSAISLSCGSGSDALSHLGVCDGYSDPSTSPYKLPWATGSSFSVSQGNCGPASHYGVSRYSYDISMDIGTPIHAARAGQVVEVVESNQDGNGCPDDNHIYIKHSDGTMAGYVHLTNGGSLVNVGDNITQGQDIGRSGNTGCSSGPHLHFMVWSDTNRTKSVPVTFSNAGPNPRGLLPGNTYTAQ